MEISEYLQNSGWEKKISESTTYFEKRGNPIDGLLLSKQLFKNLGKRRIIRLEDLLDKVNAFFKNRDYRILEGRGIINGQEDTLFIGAGVQVIYNMLCKDEINPKDRYFIAQPCLRVKALDQIGTKEGYSTSFVNICSEQVYANEDEHAANLENWFDFLSSEGLYVGHLKLVEDPKWQGRDSLDGKSILIYYGDLQIGDAVYIKGEDNKTQRHLTISDMGFGLERICWALNKSKSYYDAVGPFFESKTKGIVPLDMIRSITLMAMSGVVPSNKDVGYRFKQFVKKYLDYNKDINPIFEMDYYHNFWKKVMTGYKGAEDVKKLILDEINRHAILDISGRLGIDVKKFKANRVNDFINECLEKYPTYLESIEKLMSNS